MNLTPQSWETGRAKPKAPPRRGTPDLRLVGPETTPRVQAPRLPRLGDRLVAMGALDPGDLAKALALHGREDTRLGTILLTHDMVTEDALMTAVSEQWRAEIVDLTAERADTRLVDAWGADRCLADGLVPWRRVGGATVIATAWPERFALRRPALEALFGPVLMVLTTETGVERAVADLRARRLARRAETRVAEDLSCRGPRPLLHRVLLPALGGTGLAMALLVPQVLLLVLLAWCLVTLIAISALKAVATVRVLAGRAAPPPLDGPRGPLRRLPVISVMVPLFHEEHVADRLLKRLNRLSYPRELSDILLVCEEDDATTAAALARTRLPRWVRVVTVPRGGVQTKPRALNYALDFCRGQIVGVWDAEDAPEPEQLHKVARRFHERGPEVACLQGVLDYYNTRTNWLSRCFTIEYAAWFRAFLPVLEYLRLPIPLGGTTLFFRRDALEGLGCWDAHNVTEDADLGLRLCRAGYRTELIDTVTEEEANCAPLAWIKQRSRWLKGYGLTWAVHMRDPVALWRDLGPRGFWGVQVLFLGSLSQFILAPLLWTFWPMAFGAWHPLQGWIAPGLMLAIVGIFIASEIVSMGLAYGGLRAAGKRAVAPWILTLPAYFPLAVAACYRGIWESLRHPFLWHKTAHGIHDPDDLDGNDADPAEVRPA